MSKACIALVDIRDCCSYETGDIASQVANIFSVYAVAARSYRGSSLTSPMCHWPSGLINRMFGAIPSLLRQVAW